MGEDGYNHFHNHPVISADIANKVLRRLKLDNNTRTRVVRLVRYHDERPVLQKKTVRRKIVEIGEEAFPNLFAVERADTLAQSMYHREEKLKYIDDFENMYNEIMSEKPCLKISDLKITGKDIMDMGIKEGPVIGEILKALLEDCLEDPSHNDEKYLRERARYECSIKI